MKKHKIIMADRFMEALSEAGLLPDLQQVAVVSVTITAKAGEVVVLDYQLFGDDRLLRVAHEIEEAEDASQAGTP